MPLWCVCCMIGLQSPVRWWAPCAALRERVSVSSVVAPVSGYRPPVGGVGLGLGGAVVFENSIASASIFTASM